MTDLLRVRTLGDVTLSPDARFVAYTVTRPVPSGPPGDAEATYADRTHLYVVPARGGRAPQRLTRGPASATDPAWHPDGDRLAFVRRVDGTPQVFVLPLTGGEPYQLTRFPHGARRPRWSPNGQRLLFQTTLPMAAVRARLGRGPRWPTERPGRIPADTAFTAPPDTLVILRDTVRYAPVDTVAAALGADSLRALADARGAVVQRVVRPAARPAPSPDGALAQVRRWLARDRPGRPDVVHRLDFAGATGLAPAVSFRHWFVVDVAGTTASAPRPVTMGFAHFDGGAWLGTGQVVVSGFPRAPRDPDTGRSDPLPHPDRTRRSDLYVADADTGAVRLRLLLRLDPYRLTDPQVSPDGATVAFRATDRRDGPDAQGELGLYDLNGQTAPELLTLDHDRPLGAPRWDGNGWYLYAATPSDGAVRLARLAPFAPDTSGTRPDLPAADQTRPPAFAFDSTLARARPVEVVTDAAQGVAAFDAAGASVAYVRATAATPGELVATNASFARERLLARPNARWLARRRLAPAERLRAAGPDSLGVGGWLVVPPDTAAVPRPWPLLVRVPDAPGAMPGPGAPGWWSEAQALAARGYAVAYPHPRGTVGYGRALRRAIRRDWGPGPAGDVHALADAALARPGLDAERQALAGGGHLAAWLAAHAGARFRAVVAEHGPYDLAAFFGTAPGWRRVPHDLGGFPWDGPWPTAARMRAFLTDSTRARMLRLQPAEAPAEAAPDTSATRPLTPREAAVLNAPLTYVAQIETPLLIVDAEGDRRGGAHAGEPLFRSLKALGRPVEYVRYPRHGPGAARTPTQRLDRLLRLYAFTARFLDPPAPTPRASRE